MNDVTTKGLTEREFKVVGTRPLRPDGVDKVTGRAKFGADLHVANMLVGKVLRSPHAHARIKSIDTSKALALHGVKAVITAADFSDLPSEFIPAGEMMVNFRDMTRNIMAREKALYEGHAVAAVAATTEAVAAQALELIDVDYEVLPHVIDVEAAMAPDAPVLHDNMFTIGVDPKPAQPSNVAKRVEFNLGDIAAGFAKADVVVEREFTTTPVHQGYIEPHACLASVSEDGQAELWCTTQGQFIVRSFCAKLLGMDLAKLRVTPSEIGGGFGGKTVVYLEPLALALSRKSGQPVKMVMSRTEVFQSTGPTSGSKVWVKVGATREGRITAADALLKYQAGAFQGSPVGPGCMCAFAPYDLENVRVVGFDVVSNRPKVAAYRAPGAPIAEYAVECVIDELAKRLEIDPIEFRLKNAAKEGTKTAYGPKFGPIGLVQTLEAARAHPHYRAPLKANQGRGVASGFWFNIGGETCATLNLERGRRRDAGRRHPGYRRVACLARHDGGRGARHRGRKGAPPDRRHEHAGLHLSHRWQPRHVRERHGGHRGGPRHGAPVARTGGEDLGDSARVKWSGRMAARARPAAAPSEARNCRSPEIAKTAGKTGGPIVGNAAINAQGAGPSLATHLVDVEVDRETGRVTILRYTAIQDAGKAVHPAYVEGQMQGGAVQGIGWALNEEYIYDANGRLENPGFLDYRIPVCSDVPMIDTVIVEVPNPRHPYGVRGVGETPIVPPMAAIANAMENALGIRFTQLPMSPPRVLEAIEATGTAANAGA